MLTDVPGIGNAVLVLLALIFVWCFIFTACYAAFRIAQRPRMGRAMRAAQPAGALRYPADWNQEPSATKLTRAERRHMRYGDIEIKPAPGPRDW